MESDPGYKTWPRRSGRCGAEIAEVGEDLTLERLEVFVDARTLRQQRISRTRLALPEVALVLTSIQRS